MAQPTSILSRLHEAFVTPEEKADAFAGARDAYLEGMGERYFPGGMSSPNMDLIVPAALNRYRSEIGKLGLDPDEYIIDGEVARYPDVAWPNSMAKAAAQEAYRRGGMSALLELDPEGYGAYEGFTPDSSTDAYAEHLLPPGYAGLLRAERDYMTAKALADDPGAIESGVLELYGKGDVPFSRYSNLGSAYYPRWNGTGLMNAFSSGTEAPVANALSATEFLPNAIAYTANDPTKNPLLASLFERDEYRNNRSMGRDIPISDVPVGSSQEAKSADLMAENAGRMTRMPPTGTDFVGNLPGGKYINTGVVGDAADIGRSLMDGTPLIGSLWDAGASALTARAAGKSGMKAAGKSMALDSGIDAGITAGVMGAMPSQERTWGEYFTESTPRQSPSRGEVSQAAGTLREGPQYGTPAEANEVMSTMGTGSLGDMYKSSPEEAYRKIQLNKLSRPVITPGF